MLLQLARPTPRRSSGGQVMILIAVLSTFLIGLGGISVDLVLVYSVKTFLATATDSAAMGGVRALERGVTYADQAAEIQRTTEMLFDANFPDGLLLTGNTGKLSQNVVVAGANMDPSAPPMFEDDPTLASGMREIRVVSEAKAPTLFMRVFGVPYVHVRSAAYAARRDTNVVIVLDRSASLRNANAWDDVQQAAITFLEQFDNNRDRLGVVTFGSGANVDIPLATGFKTGDSAKNMILSQTVPQGAGTNSPLGMWLAYSELLRVGDANALNAIVFFTDGQPSAFTATFGTRVTPAYGGAPWCDAATKEAVVATSQNNSVWNSPTFDEVLGFWKPEAGPAPVRGGADDYDFEVVDGCTFPVPSHWPSYYMDYATNSELVFDPNVDWPATWTVQGPGGGPLTFCIQPGAAGCMGDQGNFFYSVSDARLYQNNSNSSADLFRGTNVHNAAKNLSLNIAQAARQDTTLGGVNVHGIGLGGYGYDADAGFMKRMANDPTDSYGVQITPAPNEPQGSYTYAPSIGELQAAFEKVRGEVMRLTR